jgi:hypothetical protein
LTNLDPTVRSFEQLLSCLEQNIGKESGKLIDPEKFEAILLEPLEYISNMIKSDWYGIVARKTTTSQKFVDTIFDKLIEV